MFFVILFTFSVHFLNKSEARLFTLPIILRVPVHITVTDVNEFPPVFSQSAYVKTVDEGRLYDEIVRVEATDRDCTPRYGDVCKYEILDSNTPFTIDNEGEYVCCVLCVKSVL